MRKTTCSGPAPAATAVRDLPAQLGPRPGRVPARAARLLTAVAMPARPAAVPVLRRLARDAVRDHRLPESVDEAVMVIVTELVTNAVLHSGGSEVAVLIEVDGPTVTVRVRDSGRWRDRVGPRREAADENTSFGRGLALVDAYAVDASVRRTDTGTVVSAVVAC
ncbi:MULTISPECIES: ATP-binding protein [Streptomyces]|uniref:Histidine kinase-, DNA gyrase B-, and HSP90-like ATPase n=1 Tax=Streptomyces rubrolavendulae TaxID=285473 RepID=A0A1D8G886_9ACTN|nr:MULTISPECIES: ATP-binding protein [Streptomyces]AOT61657.1 Histidine kinase-, DNA gyrase B-, and HSP90-like ATPase [Streptomyces rubrolavendulae]